VLIGFAGIGRMGRPMACNLVAAGHTVLGHDPAVDRMPDGVTPVADPAALAEAPISISMLPDAACTRELVLGGLSGAGPEHVHVVMGTVGPQAVRELAAGGPVAIVDAPVSGSVQLAETAAITTMIGGHPDHVERVRPVLATMTSAQFHTGPVGSGSVAKLAVNAVLGLLSHGVAEGILIAEAGGLDPAVFYEVLRGSAAGAPYVGYKEKAFLEPDAAGVAAPVSLIRKDLGLALDLARRGGLSVPASEVALAVLDEAVAAGLGEQDMARVLSALRLRADEGDKLMTETGTETGVEATIRALEDARYDAVVRGDIGAFAELAHPELTYTHSNGSVDTLGSYREKLESGFYDYHRIDHPIDRIVVEGDTALVIGEMHADITAGGTRKTLANRALAVWVRAGGAWRLLAYQPTVLPIG
jgi:3-hydroxyisobutyrate dehydrogenase-like beta-hydroxyacid dehydrogenase/ketosteroid isomerase-like protein